MKKIISVALIAGMLLALTGCGSKSSASDLEYIKEKGTLIVGITDFAPMDFKDGEGEWVGFDAELGRMVAEDLGVKIEFVEIDWDNKILELDNKSIDCVWNGMTLTDEVKNSMNCTKPYCKNAQVVVVKADKADQAKDEAGASTLSFAVEAGSAGEAVAEEKGWNYTSLSAQADALMEVEAGSSDACIIDLLMAGAMIGEGTSYADLTHTVELTEEEYGVGCRKGSDLAAFLDEEFAKFAENGSLEAVAENYGVQYALIK
ncbi:MAG: transporter substrate-binding domain-containing protein [Lachnospiraceae bacterium]|nr:transporter substrate-binding domain-containing protein [Lachnospiraceae bacterium]